MIVFAPLEPLENLLRSVLDFFHNSVGLPWAWSIVALTIVVRICLVPLVVRQIHSMQNLQAHAPQMKEIQRKYKGDRNKMNEELMKFYKENNINPAASCLPLLAQFPIFISLFYVLRHFAKEADKPGSNLGDLSWLHIVPSVADSVLSHWSGYLLLFIYAASQIASTYFMSATMDKTQRWIMMVLADRVHPADRELSDRPRPLLDDDEPLDGRAGPRHAPAGAEAGRSAETNLANAAQGRG